MITEIEKNEESNVSDSKKLKAVVMKYKDLIDDKYYHVLKHFFQITKDIRTSDTLGLELIGRNGRAKSYSFITLCNPEKLHLDLADGVCGLIEYCEILKPGEKIRLSVQLEDFT